MPYREYPRISETAAVLRYYAANIESGAIDPPPAHLPPVHQIVEVLRFIALTFDREAAGEGEELILAPEMETINPAKERFAVLVKDRRERKLAEAAERGEEGSAGARVGMRSGPGCRRRRAV